MKKITIGIFAHVDSGKTTLIERILNHTGMTQSFGRVDKQESTLDYDALERKHGLTIFDKECYFQVDDTQVFLIDTPGHIAFIQEVNIAMKVIDLAILVIDGKDAIVPYQQRLFSLLQQHHVPTVLFVNKMDIAYLSEDDFIKEAQMKLSTYVYPLEKDEEFYFLNESFMKAFEESKNITNIEIKDAMKRKEYYPIFFGTALKDQGIDELISFLPIFAQMDSSEEEVKAIVYKIANDAQKNRITYIKLIQGCLKPKGKIGEEKIDQIRLYQGNEYTLLQEAKGPMILGLKGLRNSYIGQTIGFEDKQEVLESIIEYRICFEKEEDFFLCKEYFVLLKMNHDPIEPRIEESTKSIYVHLMGDLQKEVLQERLLELNGISITFSDAEICYKETINKESIGIGHYEPLKHYAEVVLLLKPNKRNAGIEVISRLKDGDIPEAYEKVIIKTIKENRIPGILTGSELTDCIVEILMAKAHIKHSNTIDFYEATIRALRHGLMQNEGNILLEPYQHFSLTIEESILSSCLYALEEKEAEFEVQHNESYQIVGRAALSNLLSFPKEFQILSKGKGECLLYFDGYEEVKNSQVIIEEYAYDPHADLNYPMDSIFCMHGGAVHIPFKEVEKHMHLHLKQRNQSSSYMTKPMRLNDEEINRIFALTYAQNRKKDKKMQKRNESEERKQYKQVEKKPRCLIIDGYNMIYSWERFKDVKDAPLADNRRRLIESFVNYQYAVGMRMILVFDGYKREENRGEKSKEGNLDIVYTKTNETADAYIERIVQDLVKDYYVIVASSDALIQNAIFAYGGYRMSAREMENQMEAIESILEDKMHQEA
ncbi:MAG: NYN domain-containing protein [Solobacterium sp.]|nr:NYN domain-containing protein [Solobacterium sp.]